jgi:hypothetical protein
MVWLDAVENDGHALYLDRARCVRQRNAAGETVQLSGLLGDGSYEGEIQVTCSASGNDVTFADQWLAPRALAEFFQRVPRETVEAVLIDGCRARFRSGHQIQPRPHRSGFNEQRRLVRPGERESPRD